MKELMVTLLVLSCTGMVWAQLDNTNNSNRFRPRGGTTDGSALGSPDGGSAAPIVPIVDDDRTSGARRRLGGQGIDRNDTNARTRSAFGTPQPNERTSASETSGLLDTNRRVRDSLHTGSTGGLSSSGSQVTLPPLYLGLPSEAIRILQTEGRVVAPVKNSYVDRIMISDRNTPKSGPTRAINPKLRGDSLVFTFTPDDLEFTHRGSLEFEVPAYYKNKYTSATIEIPEVLDRIAQANPGRRTGPSNQTSGRTGSGFQADDNRWTLAGDTNVRERVTRDDPWPKQNANSSNRLTETERERQERLDYERWLRNKEAREKMQLADEKRRLQNEVDQLRFERRQAATGVQSGLQRPVVYSPDRYADRNFDPLRQPVVSRPAPASMDSASFAMQRLKQMEDRLALLDNQNRQLKSDLQAVNSERDDFRDRFSYNNDSRNDLVQNRDRTAGFNDRLAGKPPLQNRPAMSVGGIGNTDRNDAKSGAGVMSGQVNPNTKKPWDILLFLMLLGSVALNLYLWALSRGFYMRYQELADELRETFTVTA